VKELGVMELGVGLEGLVEMRIVVENRGSGRYEK
jgi:hypothetical protein